MLTAQTIEIVKATAPVVAANAEKLTRLFYQKMFAGNPEVKAFFNSAHQSSGNQQRALAGAICAYAANIDNLGALGPAVELIAQKHCSLGIQSEHYPIVGKHLLAAIKELLGVSDDILSAWGEAYTFLADILIKREAEIYTQQKSTPGGWNGYRPFKVERKVKESDIITSFYLKPADNQPLATFQAGQYLTVKIDHPTTPTSPRNYSLSDRPGLAHYRISVKREGTPETLGIVSSYLHDHVNEGDTLHIGPPCGEFTLKPATRPIVLLSGGVGLTPTISMLKTLLFQNTKLPIHFLHGTRNSATHALATELRALASNHPNLKLHFRYSDPLPTDTQDHYHSTGTFTPESLKELLPTLDADFYLCGPKPFMACIHNALIHAQVPPSQIHFEFFGPKGDLVIENEKSA